MQLYNHVTIIKVNTLFLNQSFKQIALNSIVSHKFMNKSY